VSVPYSRVTALLSFYDEPVEMLAAHVASLAGVVDHIVAVDGAYMLYPDGKPASDPLQMRVIQEVARGLRIGITTHTPSSVWVGNEVAKRNHLLRLAEPVTREGGWYLVLDADCIVTGVHPSWFQEGREGGKRGLRGANGRVRECNPDSGDAAVSGARARAPDVPRRARTRVRTYALVAVSGGTRRRAYLPVGTCRV
jgi:hypothetical protein